MLVPWQKTGLGGGTEAGQEKKGNDLRFCSESQRRYAGVFPEREGEIEGGTRGGLCKPLLIYEDVCPYRVPCEPRHV